MKKLTLILILLGLYCLSGCRMTPDAASAEARSNIQSYRPAIQEEQQQVQVVLESIEDSFKEYKILQLQILRGLRDSCPKYKTQTDIAFAKIDEVDKKIIQVLLHLKSLTRDTLNDVSQAQLNIESVIQALANDLKKLQIQQP